MKPTALILLAIALTACSAANGAIMPGSMERSTRAPMSSTNSSSGNTAGIYYYANVGAPVPNSAFANPNVDGIALTVGWDQVEPAAGSYDWSYIDRIITEASSAGKGVSISVSAGTSTPGWVYDAGASPFTTTISQPYSPAFCSPIRLPIPWDATYLQLWEQFVSALGSRYAMNPSVRNVKLTGMNTTTPETFLPSEKGRIISSANGASCATNDDVAEWQSVGYTAAKVRSSFSSIAGAFVTAFPNTPVIMMMIPSAFPPLNDAGSVAWSNANLQNQLINDSIAAYGAHFGVQNNGLSTFWNSPMLQNLASSVLVGYQMLNSVTNDANCRMNAGRKPCDPTSDLQQAVQRGIKAHATFLEIYHADIDNPNLAPIIAGAHQALLGGSEPQGKNRYAPYQRKRGNSKGSGAIGSVQM